MPQTNTMTIRLPIESMERLELLAKATERSRAYFAAKAIDRYLDTEEWQIQAIQEAVEDADSSDAIFLEHDEVVKRIKKINLIFCA